MQTTINQRRKTEVGLLYVQLAAAGFITYYVIVGFVMSPKNNQKKKNDGQVWLLIVLFAYHL
jgi:hypothetical protein